VEYSVILGYYVIVYNLCPFKEVIYVLLTSVTIEMLVGDPRFKIEPENLLS
jgi:hypothetical protein